MACVSLSAFTTGHISHHGFRSLRRKAAIERNRSDLLNVKAKLTYVCAELNFWKSFHGRSAVICAEPPSQSMVVKSSSPPMFGLGAGTIQNTEQEVSRRLLRDPVCFNHQLSTPSTPIYSQPSVSETLRDHVESDEGCDDEDFENVDNNAPVFTHQQLHHIIDMVVSQFVRAPEVIQNAINSELVERTGAMVAQQFKKALPIEREDEHIVAFSKNQVQDLCKLVGEEGGRAIADLMKSVNTRGNTTIRFGKHRGKSFDLVHREDPVYCRWVARLTASEAGQCSPDMLEFGKWLQDQG